MPRRATLSVRCRMMLGIIILLSVALPWPATAQDSPLALPDTNIYESRLYEPVNGVPVKKGEILPPGLWPDQPQLGLVRYTPWGAPSRFWMCVNFPALGENGTVCSYAEIMPYPPPPNVAVIPGVREWYCRPAINVLIYSKPFNLGTCSWLNPTNGIPEGAYTPDSTDYANILESAQQVLDLYEGDVPPSVDPDVEAVNAALDTVIAQIQEQARIQVLFEQSGIAELTDEEREQLIAIEEEAMACRAIASAVRQSAGSGLENARAAFTNFGEIQLSVVEIGAPQALAATLTFRSIVMDRLENGRISTTGLMQLHMKVPGSSTGEATSQVVSRVLTFESVTRNLGELNNAYQNFLQDADDMFEQSQLHTARCPRGA